MNTHPHSIEPLENRIVPAGVVTAVYDAATFTLTLTGDGVNNEVNVFQTGASTYRVEGVATSINAATFLDIGKLTSLTIDGGAGSDTFTLNNLRTLTALSFSGGIDADSLNANNLTVKGAVELHGNAGSDFVSFDGLSTLISGDVTIDSAAGATDQIDVQFSAQKTVIGGSILFTGGGGDDFLGAFGEGPASIAKGVNFNAGAGNGSVDFSNDDLLTIGKLATGESILFTGGAGDDALTFNGVNVSLAGGIRMTGGALSDSISFFNNPGTVKIGKLATGQSILFDGGVDGDSISISALSLSMAGAIDFVGGTGTNSISLQAANGIAKIGKLATGQSIRFVGGTGDDSITTNSASLTLAGGIDFTGDAGANDISLSGASGKTSIGKLATGQSVKMTGLGGDDTIATGVASLTLAGGVDFTAGDGTNLINLVADNGVVKIGKLTGGQSILFNGGTGSDDITSDIAVATLAGGIELNGAGGNNDLEFDDDGVVKIGKFGMGQSVLFTGLTDADNEIDFGGFVTLAGSVEVTGGSGTDDIDFDGKISVGKNAAGVSVSMVGNDGADDIDFTDNITLAGSLKHDGGNGDDTVDFNSVDTLTIKGAVEFIGGTGADTFDLVSFQLVLGSTLTVTGGDDADDFTLRADGSVAGDVNVDLGLAAAGTQPMTFASRTGLPGGLSLKGALTVNASAAATNDFLTITNVSVAKLIDLKLGDAVSTVNIDNLIAGDEFKLDTRGGADVVNIERGDFFGGSVIKKLATIQLGLGDDLLRIGNPIPAAIAPFPDQTRVNFLGGLNADGGGGVLDNRNDIVGENDGVLIAGLIGFELNTLV